MKKIKLSFLFVLLTSIVLGQSNQGTVNFKTVIIDTIANTITQQDSVYTRYFFKPNKSLFETGFVNRPNFQKTIVKENDIYSIICNYDDKKAYHSEMKGGLNLTTLLNYKDTSIRITKTTITKTIAGRTCKKLYLRFNMVGAPTFVLWYDETINCSSIIPGAGVAGKSVKGLIMEYEIKSPTGKYIITADSISFSTVPNSLFTPNLAGYQITELNDEGDDD